METYRHVPAFLTPDELRTLRQAVADHPELLTEVHGRGGLGPRYRVIDGLQIHHHLPGVEELGETRVRPLAEAFAGEPLAPLGSAKRSMRVQVYERKDHGFRWHFDGHPYVALVTLENGNGGQTQFIARWLSWWLRFLLYPLYAFPQLFSIFPRSAVTARPGDLLVMRGGKVLHRGVTPIAEGERILLAYTYDQPGRRPNRFRDFVAKRLNY